MTSEMFTRMTIGVVSTEASENETIFSATCGNSTDEGLPSVTSGGLLSSAGSESMTTAAILTPTRGDGRNFRFEDYAQRSIIGTIVCFVAVFGFIGNVMVILAVVLSNKLQTRTNAFVVNLAVADLVTCLCAPFAGLALFSMIGWPLPEIVCSVVAGIGYLSLACSIMNLAAIAVNRYVLITKTTATYRSIYTPKKIAAILILTWVYPVGLVSFGPIFGIGKWGYSAKYKTCTQDTSHETSDLYSLLGCLFTFPVPLVVLSVCYFKIYRHVTGHIEKMRERNIEMAGTSPNAGTTHLAENPPASFSKRQVEITKNLFYVVCAFVACLAPFSIALLIKPSDPAIPWTGMLVIFNSGVNPVIYGLKHPHFKEVFRHMLRCRYHLIPEPSSCLRKMRSRYVDRTVSIQRTLNE